MTMEENVQLVGFDNLINFIIFVDASVGSEGDTDIMDHTPVGFDDAGELVLDDNGMSINGEPVYNSSEEAHRRKKRSLSGFMLEPGRF